MNIIDLMRFERATGRFVGATGRFLRAAGIFTRATGKFAGANVNLQGTREAKWSLVYGYTGSMVF